MDASLSTNENPRTADCCLAVSEVLASVELLPAICSFLPGVPSWTIDFELKHRPQADGSTTSEHIKQTQGTASLLSRLAIQSRDLRALQRLYALHNQPQFRGTGKFWFTSATRDAAACGNVEALEWLYRKDARLRRETTVAMGIAVARGHTNIVRWLLEAQSESLDAEGEPWMDTAATHGHLEILTLLHQRGASKACSTQAMDWAATNGHVAVVEFLLAHRTEGCTTQAIDGAASAGHLEIARLLANSRTEGYTTVAVYGAMTNGHRNVIRYLCERRTIGGSDHTAVLKDAVRWAMPAVFARGDLEMVKTLHDVGSDLLPELTLMLAASKSVDLAIVKFLHRTSRPRHDVDQALLVAARANHEAMRYLLAEDRFTVDLLEAALRILDGKGKGSPETIFTLQVALALAETVVSSANCFAPVQTSNTGPATTQRAKRKTRGCSRRLPLRSLVT